MSETVGTIGTDLREATLIAALAEVGDAPGRLILGLAPIGQERMRRVSAPQRDAAVAQLVEVYRRERKALLHAARKRLRAGHDAEDVVQAAFLKTVEQALAPEAPAIREPRPFLYTVVVHECVRVNRSARGGGDDEAVLAKLPANEPVPTIIKDETLLGALARLPLAQRTCAVLRHCHGFDTAETAHIMDISPTAVTTTLQRALKNLQRYLDDHHG